MVDFLVKYGASGIFVNGTAGEFPYLSVKERVSVTRIVKDQVRSKVCVLMGVSDVSLKRTLKLVDHGVELGVDGFVTTFPQYFSLDSNDIRLILTQIHDRIPDKPVLAYDVSSVVPTTASLNPKLIIELANAKILLGLKYTGADWENYASIILNGLNNRDFFRLFAGSEALTRKIYEEGYQFDGGIYSGSNIFPRLYRDYYEAMKCKDEPLISKTLGLLFLSGGIFGTVPPSSGPGLIKEILTKLGLPISSKVHSPLPPIKDRIFKKIDKLLETIENAGYLDKYD